MKTFIRRCTLAVIMCGMSAVGFAEDTGVIFSDDFNWETTNFLGPEQTVGENSNKLWTVYRCSGKANGQAPTSNMALKLESNGYAISPEFSLLGNAAFSVDFQSTLSGSNTSKLNISITNGYFEDGNTTKQISVTSATNASNNIFTTFDKFVVYGSGSTTLKFELKSSNLGAIDNVLITTATNNSMDLYESSEDNSTTISNNANKISTVSTTRTLKCGIWNTMCLPFNVNNALMKQATEQDVELRVYNDYDTDTKVMSFSEVADNEVIAAGTPFLIKISGTKDAVNPTFKAVTVKNTAAQTVTKNGVSFIGTYDKKLLSIYDIFITADGGLSFANGSSKIKGMRAYISGISSKEEGARLSIDGIADGIDNVLPEAANTDGQWYTLSGTRIAKPTSKGIYVRDGKKIIIKK